VEKLLSGMGLYAGIDCNLGALRNLSDEEYNNYDKPKVRHYHRTSNLQQESSCEQFTQVLKTFLFGN